ncbi:MAG: Lrp/AsnC family transcriptional regulator [Candidatus Methanofastidiosia archaeon]
MDAHLADDTDRIILRELLRDARTPVRILAREANVSIGTVVNRIRHLENTGIIKGYKAIVDYEALGYKLVVATTLKIANGKYPEVTDKLREERNIITIYNVTGQYDAVLISIFLNMEELNDFLKRVQSRPFVENTHTVLVLKTTKESEINLL